MSFSFVPVGAVFPVYLILGKIDAKIICVSGKKEQLKNLCLQEAKTFVEPCIQRIVIIPRIESFNRNGSDKTVKKNIYKYFIYCFHKISDSRRKLIFQQNLAWMLIFSEPKLKTIAGETLQNGAKLRNHVH